MEEIKKNPILKKGTNNKFTKTNTYDIIMIDEAHERKVQIDLLLYLLKNAILIRKERNMRPLKLIIMSATINEISQSSANARSISENAVTVSQETSMQIKQLGESANEISNVTETITDISEQTNLLALNATIEAARAGDAGKGFAVVASEIKELAKQTTIAAKEINNKITGIQLSTNDSVLKIKEVTDMNPKIPNRENISNQMEVQFLPMKLVEQVINKIHPMSPSRKLPYNEQMHATTDAKIHFNSC